MKCEISKEIKETSKASRDPGRSGIQNPRKEGFMVSLFLLIASENSCKKITRNKKGRQGPGEVEFWWSSRSGSQILRCL